MDIIIQILVYTALVLNTLYNSNHYSIPTAPHQIQEHTVLQDELHRCS